MMIHSRTTLKRKWIDRFSGDTELDEKPIDAESQGDEFTAKDAFFLGGAMGFGYCQKTKT